MHSIIIQVTQEKLPEEDYAKESDFYENTYNFADYVGDLSESDVNSIIENTVPYIFKDIFECNKRELTYISNDKYMKEWVDALKKLSSELNYENSRSSLLMWRIKVMAECGHIYENIRIATVEGYTETFGEFIQGLCDVEKGTKFYIGGIVDYHF